MTKTIGNPLSWTLGALGSAAGYASVVVAPAGADPNVRPETRILMLADLRHAGKTIIAVHHDLRTVPQYFDYVALLNVRLVASGPVETTFTPENLKKTYGGRLAVLDHAAEALQTGSGAT